MIFIAGQGLDVTSTTGPYINSSNPSAGMMRYINYNIEVYDGISWVTLTNTINVKFDSETVELLNWAREKRKQEQEIELTYRQLKEYPAIVDLLKQKEDIEEKIKIIAILVKDHNGTN